MCVRGPTETHNKNKRGRCDNIGEDQTRAFSERGAPGTVLHVKSVRGYCITFIKKLDKILS